MKHAIVMGGSMAGLLAARTLCDHFDQVTLVERDEFPEGIDHRRGVPQGKHSHGLLAGGREEIERMFPGISRELEEAGALTGDISAQSRWFFEGGCLAKDNSGLQALAMSRPMLESFVRRRVLALPQVTARQGCQVEGLITMSSSDGGIRRVTGVQLADGTQSGNSISGDLIVDATGRGSKSNQWLPALGFPAPAEEKVEVALGYTTRHFRRDPTAMDGDFVAIIPPTPSGKRGGVMIAQEGGRWTVTLIAHFVKSAPEELTGFIEFTRGLPAPYIYDVISKAEPIGDAVCARMPFSLRRRYERLDRFPEGYLVIGDAICSFNPIYGQGMSVAAQEARVLGETLSQSHENLAKRFFAKAAKVVDNPWAIATGNDLRMPEATGIRPPGTDLINWYISKLHRAAHTDPELAFAFHRVANLLAPPPSLMHPRLALRVLRGSLRPGGTSTYAERPTVEMN